MNMLIVAFKINEVLCDNIEDEPYSDIEVTCSGYILVFLTLFLLVTATVLSVMLLNWFGGC